MRVLSITRSLYSPVDLLYMIRTPNLTPNHFVRKSPNPNKTEKLASIATLTKHKGNNNLVSLADHFVCILRGCISKNSLIEGKKLHAHILVSGFKHDLFVLNHLINMYGKCGCLDYAHLVFVKMGRRNLHSWNTMLSCYCRFGFVSDARQLFDEMPQKDSVSWNTMIAGYDQHGPCEKALEIFIPMRKSDSKVDHFSVSSVISACSNLGFLGQGKELHGYSICIGVDLHVHVGSALIGLYSKCVDIDAARKVFDEMPNREVFTWNSMLAGYVHCAEIDQALVFFREFQDKNVVSWTTLIAGCSNHDRCGEAINYFGEMRQVDLKPDQVSFVTVLNACSGLYALEEGVQMHGLIIKTGFERDVVVGSALVDMYAKCGSLYDADGVIEKMPFVDDFSWSVLIFEYAKCGWLDRAHELFKSLEVKSLACWNSMIAGYCELGMDEEAVELFKEMQMEGINGDEFTFGSLIEGSDLLSLRYQKQLHLQTIKIGLDSSTFVGSALVDMYAKSLNCEAARLVFNAICVPNLVSWNAMISGYAQNERGQEAIEMFSHMRALGMTPDRITYSSVLNACTSLLVLPTGKQIHGLAHQAGFESDIVVGCALIDMYAKCGDIDLAYLVFSNINQHNVVSWTAMVGGYVRCGMWDSAKEMFDKMPERNIVSWNTMISGYAQHGYGLEAFGLYLEMNKSGILPDRISFISMLIVCCGLMLEEQGKQVHAQIIKTGYYLNLYVKSSIINMYQKLRNLSDTQMLRPETALPDIVSSMSTV